MRLLLIALSLGLLLAAQFCAGRREAPAAEYASVAPTTTRQAAEPVALRLRALLDTTGAGAAATTEKWGLQAGAAVYALYGSPAQPLWTQPADSLSRAAHDALILLARAPEHGLPRAAYHWLRLQALRDSLARPALPAERRAATQARLELYLSDGLLRFLLDLHRGRLRTYTASARERAAGQPFRPEQVLREALTAGRLDQLPAGCQPANREYRQLQQALARWLRATPADSAAARRPRYELAALNLERWRWDALADEEYVLINLPAFELQVIAADSLMRRHRVIVGEAETPTPTLSSRITHFTLAPDWYVPRSIASRELLTWLKRDPGYLARNNYSLYDTRGRPLNPHQINWQPVTPENFAYSFRQSAGCDNALGNIVFRFANPYAVYLHDTPLRQFFEQPERAFSHGCIRLEQPMELAAYLLRREGRPVELPSEAECARQPRPRDVRLRRPLPLHIRYATCAAQSGELVFYPDVYRRDPGLRRALFAPGQL
ncbi:L,D-transpeptidase family protein [Hymenobacter sp. B81]|uniref:L,D-transpeptidase family protein n=1 Tax=Hymenobacter sp. B81 TaxID=3344878 RepID=UPI0037DD42F0